MAPRLTSVSFVTYFLNPNVNLARLVAEYCRISIGLVGDIEVEITLVGEGSQIRTTRGLLSESIEVDSAVTDFTIIRQGDQRHKDHHYDFTIIEQLFTFEYRSWNASFGRRFGPIVYIDFGLNALEPDNPHPTKLLLLPDIANQLFMASSQCGNVACAFGDIADFYETSFGGTYSETVLGWLHPHRLFNQYLWAKAGEERLNKARGVYWANYWGKHLVERVGNAANLASEYQLLEPRIDPVVIVKRNLRPDHKLCTLFDDGSMSFLLTRSPRYFMFPYQGLSLRDDILQRQAWIYGKLRAADAII